MRCLKDTPWKIATDEPIVILKVSDGSNFFEGDIENNFITWWELSFLKSGILAQFSHLSVAAVMFCA